MILLRVICVEEPDISYTRNKKLSTNTTYWATYEEANLGHFGICPIYTIYNDDKIKLGEYYARDFQTVEEYRNKKLEDLLNLSI